MTQPTHEEEVRLHIASQPAQRITTTLKVMAIIALALWIAFNIFAVIAFSQIADTLNKVATTPTITTPTGCPFGDTECGG